MFYKSTYWCAINKYYTQSSLSILIKTLSILCLIISFSCESDEILDTKEPLAVTDEQEQTPTKPEDETSVDTEEEDTTGEEEEETTEGEEETTEEEGETPMDTTVETNEFQNAHEIIAAMGTGFNLGNTFDLNIQDTNPNNIYPIIDLYYAEGMRHVRIPVTWLDGFDGNTLADVNGHVNFSHSRFIQLQAIIDYAIAKGMYVVLNAHHEKPLFLNYDDSPAYNSLFTNLWTDIATHFKDYSQLLIFEVLNEPHGVFGHWGGSINPKSSNALQLTRKINQVGYTAIRETGGKNSYRTLMISTNARGSIYLIDDVYPVKTSLPGEGNDNHLAMHVHTYDPWAFCGQTGNNSAWPGENFFTTLIENAADDAQVLEIPLNIGEFGVGRQSNTAERNTDLVRNYYNLIRNSCLNNNIAPTVWDDRGWYGLIASNTGGQYMFTNTIVPAMMMP